MNGIKDLGFHYSVFGMLVRSNVCLPPLVAVAAAANPADLELHLGISPFPGEKIPLPGEELVYVSPYTEESGEPSLRIWGTPGGSLLRLSYCDGTQFWVDRTGKTLWACWSDALSLENTLSYLLGPVLGLLLRLRGVVCLHASAVAFGDYSIAFVGAAGAGKSTTAAAFAREGHAVLSDDVVALAERDGVFHVLPAYPHVSLWPESVTMLYGSEVALPHFTKGWDKRRLALGDAGNQFERRSLPLGAIYLLGPRQAEAPGVKDISPQAAFLDLVTNTYATNTLDREKRGEEFAGLGRLFSKVPVRQVCPSSDPNHLKELCRSIEDDFAGLRNRTASKP